MASEGRMAIARAPINPLLPWWRHACPKTYVAPFGGAFLPGAYVVLLQGCDCPRCGAKETSGTPYKPDGK